MTRRRSHAAAVALSAAFPLAAFPLAAAFAAGCGNESELAAAQAPAPTLFTRTRPVNHLDIVPDETIRATVARELGRDPFVGPQRVGVDSAGGVVTLEGTVSNHLAARRAVEIAHVVRGVRAIVDRVSVAPTARPDYELDWTVAAKLANDDAIRSQRIGERTHDGAVRLSGDVDSGAARRIAIADVLAIPGVKAVVDHLSVSPPETRARTDRTLDAEVARTLGSDPWLDDAHVAVEAENGVVKLTGWVGNAAERARAEQDARTASPNGVDLSALRIDTWTDDGTLRTEPPAGLPDRDVTQALADAYVLDPRVHPFVPGIDVRNDVVVLTGIAPNCAAAAAAVADARNVPGVLDVRDDLQTRAALGEGDRIVRTDIETAIDRDPKLASMRLTVDVADGRVILRGTVDSEQDRLHAVTVASTTPGVRMVLDRIAVEPSLTRANDEATGRAERQPSGASPGSP